MTVRRREWVDLISEGEGGHGVIPEVCPEPVGRGKVVGTLWWGV